jgi:DnaK suppressor protein
MLTETVRREFARRLHAQKEEIIVCSKKEMKRRMAAENRQTMGAGLEECDCAYSCQSDHLHFRNLGTQRSVVRQIDTALDKLEEGSFGICEECNAEIDERRLRVLPFARFCRDCQELHEEVGKESITGCRRIR